MVITKTPFRMSFFGGGTDIKDYFRENKGAVISTTIDKYCYVTVRHLPKFFDYKTHLTYSEMEYVNKYSEIRHPLIRHCMELLNMHELRLTYDADLPAKSGLGTSSSFAVGMLNAFYALKGRYADKRKLADEAIYLERVLCDENGGWQDQIAAAFGGFNRIDFSSEGYKVHPIIISPEKKKTLSDNLIMFFTGFTRFSANVQQVNTVQSEKRTNSLKEMYQLVEEAEKILTSQACNLDKFGELLDYTWQLKKKTGSAVSNDSIDDLYERAIKAGALGGKLLGAGGGGFLVFYVRPEQQSAVKKELKELLYIPFEFESGGTQVVHYAPEMYVNN